MFDLAQLWHVYKNETQKIANLLNDTNNESSQFAARKWYIINDQSYTEYDEGNENDSSIKFETKVIKSSLCDYSDAYMFVICLYMFVPMCNSYK